MARDRKRSKQRQQRRARAHRDDARSPAQRAFGRTAEEDAAALNSDDTAASSNGEPDAGDAEVEAVAAEIQHHEEAHGAEHEIDSAAADPSLLAADPEIIGDPTADARFAEATAPDFDQPIRPRFEESDYDEDDDRPSGGGVVAGVLARPTPARPVKGNRVTGFLRASWAELQRVQWPNRQQVFQATAVVLGFVVVAGAFLAFADFLAGKIVDAIL
jgi:preprotein translocase subunit SecE